MNFAQPGFTFDNKLALARRWVPRLRPALVLWEVWANDPRHYSVLGSTAYSLTGLDVGPDGYPDAFGLPRLVNAWLFRRSRLYEYASIGLAPTHFQPWAVEWREFAEKRLVDAFDLAARNGAKILLVLCPALDRELRASARSLDPGYAAAVDVARRLGVPYVRLDEELAAEDYRAVRLDPCCHFNARGHAAIADALHRRLLPLLPTAGR